MPNWQVTAGDIGLPTGVPLSGPYDRDAPFLVDGDRAYFATTCRPEACGDEPRGAVYGLDLRTGASLFAPIVLDGLNVAWGCFGNGPAVAVCHSRGRHGSLDNDLLWVLDLHRGRVTARVPTDLTRRDGAGREPEFHRVGDRLVVTEPGDGAHGIGPDGRLSWSAPGSGRLIGADSPDQAVLTQIPMSDDPHYRVFAVADGTDLTPTPPSGVTLRRATAYPGGFAYQYEATDGIGVPFYDTAGTLRRRLPLASYTLLDDAGIPAVYDHGVLRVYSVAGEQLAQIPAGFATEVGITLQIAAGHLLVAVGPGERARRWQRWDLATGRLDGECTVDLTGFLGATEHVVATAAGDDVVAVDFTSCTELWRQPYAPPLRQAGSTLLQLRDDEIVGFAAPR